MRFYPGHVVAEALGSRDELEGVRLVALDGDLHPVPGRATDIACDTVCLAIGLVPQVELLQILGCRLLFRSEQGGFVPEIDADQRTSLPDVFAPGDVAGVDERTVLAPERAIAAGRRAGPGGGRVPRGDLARGGAGAPPRDLGAAARAGSPRARLLAPVAAGHAGRGRLGDPRVPVRGGDPRRAGRRPAPRYLGSRSDQMRARDLGTLKQDGPPNPDQVKRLTRAGMGPCQGRRCREQVALLLAEAGDVPVDTIALASYRPPVRPLPLSVLWPHDEPPAMREHWVSWFGIPTQFAPHWAGDPDMTVMLDVPGGAPVE